jgi:hypothetical protein
MAAHSSPPQLQPLSLGTTSQSVSSFGPSCHRQCFWDVPLSSNASILLFSEYFLMYFQWLNHKLSNAILTMKSHTLK